MAAAAGQHQAIIRVPDAAPSNLVLGLGTSRVRRAAAFSLRSNAWRAEGRAGPSDGWTGAAESGPPSSENRADDAKQVPSPESAARAAEAADRGMCDSARGASADQRRPGARGHTEEEAGTTVRSVPARRWLDERAHRRNRGARAAAHLRATRSRASSRLADLRLGRRVGVERVARDRRRAGGEHVWP